MELYTRLTYDDFRSNLLSDDCANWEPWAVSLLWDHCEELIESYSGCDVETFLNACDALTCRVAIRCDWSQYDDIEEWYSEHGDHCNCPAPDGYDDIDDWRNDCFEWLTDNRQILWNGDVSGGFVADCNY